MMAVAVQAGTTLTAARSRLLFEYSSVPPGAGTRHYDLAPDGRFYIIHSEDSATGNSDPSNMVLVENWSEELKRLVPVK